MKKVINIIKRIILSILLLYSYNILAQSLNLIIPINIITILVMAFVGYHTMFFLIAILFFCF